MKTASATFLAFALIGFGSLAGCATTQLPASELSGPKAQMAAAEEVGANENPQASLHLKLANDQYDLATKALKDGDSEHASRLLARAGADAELALQLARLDNMRDEANKAMKSIEDMRREHRLTTDY